MISGRSRDNATRATSLISVAHTVAPSSANAMAVARPIPWAAAVITAVFPLSLLLITSLLFQLWCRQILIGHNFQLGTSTLPLRRQERCQKYKSATYCLRHRQLFIQRESRKDYSKYREQVDGNRYLADVQTVEHPHPQHH